MFRGRDTLPRYILLLCLSYYFKYFLCILFVLHHTVAPIYFSLNYQMWFRKHKRRLVDLNTFCLLCLSSFLMFQDSSFHCSSCLRMFFSLSFWVDLMVRISTFLFYVKMSWLSPSSFKDISMGYRIVDWKFFSFNTWRCCSIPFLPLWLVIWCFFNGKVTFPSLLSRGFFFLSVFQKLSYVFNLFCLEFTKLFKFVPIFRHV